MPIERNGDIQRNYKILPPGWGCSCEENRSITSKEECLSVANDIVKNNLLYHEDINEGKSSLENIINENNNSKDILIDIFEYTWNYGPCGCFLWKRDRKVFYNFRDINDDDDNFKCMAVQWAELICKKEEGDNNVVAASEVADLTVNYKPTARVEDSMRKCLDWVEFLPLRLSKDRDFCIGSEGTRTVEGSGSLIEEKKSTPVLGLCSNLDTILELYYTSSRRLELFGEYNCLSAGTQIGLPVKVEPCAFNDDSQIWIYYSDGRFKNVQTGGYLQPTGCGIMENVTLVTQEIASFDEDCDFSQWMVSYIHFDSLISTTFLKESAHYFCFILAGV